MLEMISVCTSYGAVPMLRSVSLKVGKGELVCLLGPNGAGKSTTFNAICGLLRCDSGGVRIAGRDVKDLGAERLASLGERWPRSFRGSESGLVRAPERCRAENRRWSLSRAR